MYLKQLALTDYRNVEQALFCPCDELNVICGENGQGKTSLLEAVWMMTGGKSFRGAKDAELIRHGAEFALLDGRICSDLGEDAIFISVGSKLSQRPGRHAKVNGVDAGRAANVAGTFTAVVFDPGNLSLVKGSPEGRRRFLDTALCQLYPSYLKTLRRYARLVTQKNSLLKNWHFTQEPHVLCDAFDEALATTGEEIRKRRKAYIDALGPIVAANYADISQNRERLQIEYQTQVREGAFLEELKAQRTIDRRAGFCTIGTHRDDIRFGLDGQEAKVFASQGQQRSCVLSLKLAEASIAKEVTTQQPVMLLDDVLSELDAGRQEYLLTRMKGRQTIVTACDSSLFHKTEGRMFRMEQGRLSEI